MSEIDVTKCEFYGKTMHPTKNCTMDSEYLHSCEGSNCYYKQLQRYKQAIKEIKDIATNMSNDCFYSDFKCGKKCDMESNCTFKCKNQIIQKCEEVINDRL